jgi:phage-related protein
MLANELTLCMIEIDFYKTDSGKNPIIEFFDSLSGKQLQKITWVLELLEDTGSISKQYFKKLINTDDIWEIRIIYSGNIFRLLGFFFAKNHLILTNGFQKKTQKTPKSEIELAVKRKRDFIERNK